MIAGTTWSRLVVLALPLSSSFARFSSHGYFPLTFIGFPEGVCLFGAIVHERSPCGDTKWVAGVGDDTDATTIPATLVDLAGVAPPTASGECGSLAWSCPASGLERRDGTDPCADTLLASQA
jgi:hypothetical protein